MEILQVIFNFLIFIGTPNFKTPVKPVNNKAYYKTIVQTLNLNFNSGIRKTNVAPIIRNVAGYGYALWTYWNHQLATT